MGKSFSTVLLAIGAIFLVGAAAFLISTTALGGDGNESTGATDTASGGEQHVLFENLGMT